MSIEETATVCSPIKSLKDLLNVSASSLTARLRSSPLIQRYVSPRAKVLLCHDMRGGYLEDKYAQQSADETTPLAICSIAGIPKDVVSMKYPIDSFVGT